MGNNAVPIFSLMGGVVRQQGGSLADIADLVSGLGAPKEVNSSLRELAKSGGIYSEIGISVGFELSLQTGLSPDASFWERWGHSMSTMNPHGAPAPFANSRGEVFVAISFAPVGAGYGEVSGRDLELSAALGSIRDLEGWSRAGEIRLEGAPTWFNGAGIAIPFELGAQGSGARLYLIRSLNAKPKELGPGFAGEYEFTLIIKGHQALAAIQNYFDGNDLNSIIQEVAPASANFSSRNIGIEARPDGFWGSTIVDRKGTANLETGYIFDQPQRGYSKDVFGNSFMTAAQYQRFQEGRPDIPNHDWVALGSGGRLVADGSDANSNGIIDPWEVAGHAWTPRNSEGSADWNGDGRANAVDRALHDVDLHERHAQVARFEGNDSKARSHELAAQRAQERADQAARQQHEDDGGHNFTPSSAPTTSARPTQRPDNDNSSGGGGGSAPILLDLDGDGVAIRSLDRSDVFMDTTDDGLLNRTAWADAGDGVLFVDVDGDGEISETREFIFTEWDPTARSDFAALRFRSIFATRYSSDNVGQTDYCGEYERHQALGQGAAVGRDLVSHDERGCAYAGDA